MFYVKYNACIHEYSIFYIVAILGAHFFLLFFVVVLISIIMIMYIAEWDQNSKANFTELWPHWDKTIKDTRPDIDSISKEA